MRWGEAVGPPTIEMGIASFVSSIAMGTNLLSSMDAGAPIGPNFGPGFEPVFEPDFELSFKMDELVMKSASFWCMPIT